MNISHTRGAQTWQLETMGQFLALPNLTGSLQLSGKEENQNY